MDIVISVLKDQFCNCIVLSTHTHTHILLKYLAWKYTIKWGRETIICIASCLLASCFPGRMLWDLKKNGILTLVWLLSLCSVLHKLSDPINPIFLLISGKNKTYFLCLSCTQPCWFFYLSFASPSLLENKLFMHMNKPTLLSWFSLYFIY